MTNLFISLLFLSIILLLAGLIKPSLVIRWGENRSRKKVSFIFGAAIIILFVLIGITAEPRSKTSDEQAPPQITTTPTTEPSLETLPTPAPTPMPTPTPTPIPPPKPVEKTLSYTTLKDYGARLEILVQANPTISQLKQLILNVSSGYCGDKKTCIVNIYDDQKAYGQLQDFSNPIYDEGYPESEFKKIEAHFIGQYSRWPDATTRRYRQSGQWVNF